MMAVGTCWLISTVRPFPASTVAPGGAVLVRSAMTIVFSFSCWLARLLRCARLKGAGVLSAAWRRAQRHWQRCTAGEVVEPGRGAAQLRIARRLCRIERPQTRTRCAISLAGPAGQ